LARLEEVRRATKRPSVTERDADFYDRKRMTVEAAPSARYSSSQSRFEESKSSSHYSSGSVPAASDYRKVADRGYVDSRSRGERFDRTAGASSSSVVTRRVVEEVGPARRDARPPPSPPRERDDRRVVERVRDDRYIDLLAVISWRFENMLLNSIRSVRKNWQCRIALSGVSVNSHYLTTC
jgi:hypothetical protein